MAIDVRDKDCVEAGSGQRPKGAHFRTVDEPDVRRRAMGGTLHGEGFAAFGRAGGSRWGLSP